MPQLAWSQVFLNEDVDKGKRKADPAGVPLGISTERWCRSSKRSILLRQIAGNEGRKDNLPLISLELLELLFGGALLSVGLLAIYLETGFLCLQDFKGFVVG